MLAPLFLSLSLAGSPNYLWGDVGFGMYPLDGEKVAPNGYVYEPMFRLVADVQYGVRESYGFFNSSYYAEKPNPGVTTNKTQGSFDFTKRQYDFNIGYAKQIADYTEARLWLYSYSNINRGRSPNKPYGFKDGFVGALRYYLENVATLNGHVAAGYYFTKDLVDTEGNDYSPGFFAEADVTRYLGLGVRGYFSVVFLTERYAGLKQIDTRAGFEYRFGERHKNTAYLYFENDFGEDGLTERRRILLEFRRSFEGS